MSDLLNSASLVMIPSGYKEDTIYSVVPSDGSGDLSFTRASDGTRVNSAGLVEVVAWNLCTYSEEFNNASGWTQDPNGGSITITANYGVAPNGTTTADRIQITKGPNYAQVYQTSSVISGAQYTISVYLKSLSGTPTISTLFNSGVAGTQTLTTEWVRYDFTFTAASSTIYPLIGLYGAGSTTVADILAWGYQLNIGSTAKPYFPTTDRLNVPRLTYQNGGGGCPSLLLEKQSTNTITYSEQFDNVAWTKQNLNVTANNTTSPDGTQNADKLIANTTNARHLIYQAIGVGVSTYTFTTYAKAGENSFLIMRLDTDSPEVKTWFNLSNGTIGTSEGGSPTITSVGNGWYRCSVQFVSSTSQTVYTVLYTATTDGSDVFTGNNSDGTYAYGAQLEASSYPTSYIPTTSSSATRVADACFKTGISSLIGQTEGVIFYDGVLTGISNPYANLINSEKNVTGSFAIGQTITGSILAQLFVNGSSVIAFDAGSYALGTRTKIAFAYKSGSFALYANGTQLGTSAATFTPVQNIDDIYIGDVTTYFNYKENTQVNQVALFKTRLTNSELASLTTI